MQLCIELTKIYLFSCFLNFKLTIRINCVNYTRLKSKQYKTKNKN